MTIRGLSGIFYGWEGLGKTSLCLQFKKDLLCISINENGYANLEMVGDVPDDCENVSCKTWLELLNILRKQGKDYATVVIDSISGIQQILTTHIIATEYKAKDNPQQCFASFSEGMRIHAPIYMETLCNILTMLNEEGVNTLLIGHSKMETVKNPNGLDYNATVIDMESWPRAVLKKWAAFICYMTLDMEVMATKTWKGKPTEAKVRTDLEEDSDRILYTTKNASHEAKNLLHLPPYISLGDSPQEAYERFFKCLPKPIQEAQAQ